MRKNDKIMHKSIHKNVRKLYTYVYIKVCTKTSFKDALSTERFTDLGKLNFPTVVRF